MEQPNNIDQLFQQRLQQAEVPPPDVVWTNVQRALQRRKRRMFFWLFAVGLLGSCGAWALWSQHTNSSTDRALVAVPQAVQKPGTLLAPAEMPGTPATGSSPEENTRPSGSTATPGTSTPLETTAAKLQTPGNAGSAPARSRIGQGAAASAPTASSTGYHRTTTSSGNQKVKGAAPALSISTPLTTPPAADPTLSPLAAPQAAVWQTADLLPGRLPLVASSEQLPDLQPIALPPLKKKSPKKCYDFHSNRQAWLFDAYAGPSFIRKNLYSADPEYKGYAQDRLATETRDLAYHAGLRASYLFAENFILRTGLHYEQFVERFEYIDPNFIQYNISVTQKYINGQWVTVTDTTDIQYGANYVKTYNRFSLLDIPLQAALELRSGVTGVSLNLGGSVNVLFKQSGSILNIDGKPVGLDQFQVFKPKLGMSLLGSIQWFYHLTPRTRVFAEPYYRHILEPVTRAGYPVEQSYGVGGIRFGLTQIFD